MGVGDGYVYPQTPGGEVPASSSATTTPLGVVLGTRYGCVVMFDPDIYYDGFSRQGYLLAAVQYGDDLLLNFAGLAFTAGEKPDGFWLINKRTRVRYRIGTGVGNTITLYDRLLADFDGLAGAGATGDGFAVGEIDCWRDFSVMRPPGSINLTEILLDHEGAVGLNTDTYRDVLYAQVYTQGLRPDTLTRVGSTTVNETAIASTQKRTRLHYDAVPAQNPRTSRARLRLHAIVRNTAITIHQVRLKGLSWPR